MFPLAIIFGTAVYAAWMYCRHKQRQIAAREQTASRDWYGTWGLLDTVEDAWLGQSGALLLYSDRDIADVCALMVDEMLKWPLGRTKATRYERTFSQAPLRLRDELPIHMSAIEALNRVEGNFQADKIDSGGRK